MSENTGPDAQPEKGEAAQPPEAPGPSSQVGGDSKGSQSGSKMLLGIGIAILTLVVVAASFGLGYVIGNKDEGAPAIGRAALRQNVMDRLGGAQGEGGQGSTLRGRVRQMVESGEASVVRGSVSSVQEGAVTVETEEGRQTVDLSDRTRYLVAGGGAEGAGPAVLAQGQQVQVLANKADDGKLHAVMVRIGAPKNKASQDPGPGQEEPATP